MPPNIRQPGSRGRSGRARGGRTGPEEDKDDGDDRSLGTSDEADLQRIFGDGGQERDVEEEQIERLSDAASDGSGGDSAVGVGRSQDAQNASSEEEAEEVGEEPLAAGRRQEPADEEAAPKRRRITGKTPDPQWRGSGEGRPPFGWEVAQPYAPRRRQRGNGPGAAAFGPSIPPPPLPPPQQRPERKKPSANLEPRKLCPGFKGCACPFSTTRVGAPAHITPTRKQTHCPLCSVAELNKTLVNKGGGELTKLLQMLHAMSEDIYNRALRRLAEELKDEAFAAEFAARVKRSLGRTEKRAAAVREKAMHIAEKWQLFTHISSEIVFTAVRRVSLDGDKALNHAAIELARTHDWFSDWDYKFYLDTWRKRKMTKRQQKQRVRINKKVLRRLKDPAAESEEGERLKLDVGTLQSANTNGRISDWEKQFYAGNLNRIYVTDRQRPIKRRIEAKVAGTWKPRCRRQPLPVPEPSPEPSEVAESQKESDKEDEREKEEKMLNGLADSNVRARGSGRAEGQAKPVGDRGCPTTLASCGGARCAPPFSYEPQCLAAWGPTCLAPR